MAAQLILLSRWDARSEPLVDPMAGGATIPRRSICPRPKSHTVGPLTLSPDAEISP